LPEGSGFSKNGQKGKNIIEKKSPKKSSQKDTKGYKMIQNDTK
jgi:hypothetical protein